MLSTYCRSCSADILWAKTESGKTMPINAEPVADGLFYLFDRAGSIISIIAMHVTSSDPQVEAAKQRGDKRYHSHFSTCPNAAKHRKTKTNP